MVTHKLLFASIACLNTVMLLRADKAPAITDLGLGTEILAINDRGQIAFTATDPTNKSRQAILWENGIRTYLGFLPGDTQSWTADLNNQGQVVGWTTGTCSSRAFVWQQGVMTPLGGCSTQALGINNRGQIVGSSSENSTSGRAVMWQDGKMVDLGVPTSNFGSAARAINDRGQIVGQYGINGLSRAFLWENGHVTDLGVLPSSQGCGADDINNQGQVVGWCFVSGFLQAFLWENGIMTGLEHPTGIRSSVAGHINERGEIVGSASGSDFQSRAVMWQHGKFFDLTTMIAPSAWRLFASYSINDRGQVVGLGDVNEPPVDVAFQGFLLDVRGLTH